MRSCAPEAEDVVKVTGSVIKSCAGAVSRGLYSSFLALRRVVPIPQMLSKSYRFFFPLRREESDLFCMALRTDFLSGLLQNYK